MNLSDLQSAIDYVNLEILFGIPPSKLPKEIYSTKRKYQTFEISKKSGGVRIIESPVGVVRKIQSDFVSILNDVYSAPECAHGFVRHRSIVSNAHTHLDKNLVINVDLKDFFKTISFQRLRRLFLARPFRFNWTVANVMAHICCCDGRLPAGGITSPVISNIILSKLDKRLHSLAKNNGGDYSRYADDLTFSFDRTLKSIPQFVYRDSDGNNHIGRLLESIIIEEGFQINPEKFRASELEQRKVVTGITINKKLNVNRRWLNKLKSVVHIIQRHGVEDLAKRNWPGIELKVAERIELRKVHGRLSFLYMVRGEGDWIAADLAYKFNCSHSDSALRIPDTELISQAHRVSRGVVIVTAHKSKEINPTVWDEQGSGFIVKNGYIVTAEHVIFDEDSGLNYPVVKVRSGFKPNVSHECEIIFSCKKTDIAVLRLINHNHGFIRSRFLLESPIYSGVKVQSFGYPRYNYMDDMSQQKHEITLIRTIDYVKKLEITGKIAGGLSGGPILDEEFRVIGMVHKGKDGVPNEIISEESITKALHGL